LILITGGCGFIGSHLTKHLLSKSYSVKVIDVNPPGELLSDVKGKFEFEKVDILDREKLKIVTKNCNTIFHLCALFGRLKSVEKPYENIKVNLEGTLNVLEAARKNDVDKFIFMSSSLVYGEAVKVPMDENHPINPVTPYGIMKYAAERLCLFYHNMYGIKVLISRPFNVYGPGEYPSIYRGVISRFIWNVLNNKPLEVTKDSKRTFQFVTDFVEGLRLLMEKGKPGEVYNLCSEEVVTIEELAKKIIEMCNKTGKINIIYKNPSALDVKIKIPSGEKARKELGYQPKTSLYNGLKQTITWMKKLLKSGWGV
jgi:UDP-glucose 4-epimerase